MNEPKPSRLMLWPAEPSAGIMDSQSVAESAEGVVPTATSGYDGHKKVNGRKRTSWPTP